VVRDRVYEHNEYEFLRVMRGETEIGTEDPKRFIENEVLKTKKAELDRMKAKQGLAGEVDPSMVL
jgi:hypothetical protein